MSFKTLRRLHEALLVKTSTTIEGSCDPEEVVAAAIDALSNSEKLDLKKEIIYSDIHELSTKYTISESASEDLLASACWDLASAEAAVERAIQAAVLTERLELTKDVDGCVYVRSSADGSHLSSDGAVSNSACVISQASKITSDRRRRFSCTDCPKTFAYHSRLEAHMITHADEKPLACCHCEARFGRQDLLVIHERLHLNDKPYRCRVRGCRARFAASKYLTAHARTHEDVRPYGCGVCPARFRTLAHQRCHSQYHAGKQGRVRCDVCGQEMCASSLRRHMLLHERRKNVTSLTCTTCGAKMRDTFQLRVHARVHTGERPFTCRLCDRSFASANTLQKHQRTHTLEKPFACSVCGSSFARRDTLKAHARSHRGDRPFSCDECDKKFVQRAHLQRHMRNLHANEVVKAKVSRSRGDSGPAQALRPTIDHCDEFDS